MGTGMKAAKWAALTLTVLLTGCTAEQGVDSAASVDDGTSSPGDELGDVSIAEYSDVTAQLDFAHAAPTLPLDQYYLGSTGFSYRALHAIAAVTDTCMVDRGYPAVAETVDWTPSNAAEDRTYGLWSVENASQYGVSLAPGKTPPTVETLSYGIDFNNAYAACLDTAKETLMDELLFSQDPNIDSQIRGRARELTRASDEGKAAFADWQACMEGEGIVLDPEDGRPSSQYADQGKESEIKTAVVEAQCAASTAAIQTLYDLQARYEAAFLDKQEAQVQEFVKEREAVIAIFEAAIAGNTL